ncbi:polyprenyl synthetase family protein [Agromyces marinus]|uniref:Geranylgeranyl pyrophosphate synthase n=1 Tax=Agromyces marinus TaxID=1389020 RepID=A0ABM8GY28_9MICO|nr:polyprenyl synthetase family protein [Agromyces marinus]UIP58403.1 (2E,6E)-farnesyl diphosphate synthase [Agromyces marinus]BDZ53342.1 geranylgeranyl pyrophosphate synthase [Agromyces marinus]
MPERLDADVDEGLRVFFAEARLRAGAYGSHYAALWESIEHQSSGGKRIRPGLVWSAYRGFGGVDRTVVTGVALAFELLHTAFLIHDDLIDRDTVRRGVPNVAGRFAARATEFGGDARASEVWGATAAVLAGDLALSRAHREIAILPIGDDRRRALLDILDHAVFVSAAGELADVVSSLHGSTPELEGVLAMLEQKTAVYSFEAPLSAGAVLAGAPASAVAALGRFGRLAGVAFQITDDVLGVFGDPVSTGKSASADLREGKRTALIAHAAATTAWPEIRDRLGDPALDDAGASALRERLRGCGALDAAVASAAEHVTLALHELEGAEVPLQLRSELAGFAQQAIGRVR